MTLKTLTAARERATALPWKTDAQYVVGPVPAGRPGGEVIGQMWPTVTRLLDERQMRDNATFVVEAVNALPVLLEIAEAARAYLDLPGMLADPHDVILANKRLRDAVFAMDKRE